MYYCVRVDKKSWTKNNDVAIEVLEENGFAVYDSRLHGDKDVFFKGKKVSTLFLNKTAAALYVNS